MNDVHEKFEKEEAIKRGGRDFKNSFISHGTMGRGETRQQSSPHLEMGMLNSLDEE